VIVFSLSSFRQYKKSSKAWVSFNH
jgi:hypothetical protein